MEVISQVYTTATLLPLHWWASVKVQDTYVPRSTHLLHNHKARTNCALQYYSSYTDRVLTAVWEDVCVSDTISITYSTQRNYCIYSLSVLLT